MEDTLPNSKRLVGRCGRGISWVKGSLCFVLKFALPPFSPPRPYVVQLSKQNRHLTFDPINTSTPADQGRFRNKVDLALDRERCALSGSSRHCLLFIDIVLWGKGSYLVLQNNVRRQTTTQTLVDRNRKCPETPAATTKYEYQLTLPWHHGQLSHQMR